MFRHSWHAIDFQRTNSFAYLSTIAAAIVVILILLLMQRFFLLWRSPLVSFSISFQCAFDIQSNVENKGNIIGIRGERKRERGRKRAEMTEIKYINGPITMIIHKCNDCTAHFVAGVQQFFIIQIAIEINHTQLFLIIIRYAKEQKRYDTNFRSSANDILIRI